MTHPCIPALCLLLSPVLQTPLAAQAATQGQGRAALLNTLAPAVPLRDPGFPRYVVTDLGTLGGEESGAWGLNSRGDITGEAQTAGGQTHAFLYRNGKMTDLETLHGGAYSVGRAINDRDDIVGFGQKEPRPAVEHGKDDARRYPAHRHAFLYRDGRMTDLGTLPGDDISEAYGINAKGQIVGLSYQIGDVDARHGFLLRNGRMTDLGLLPQGRSSAAFSINAAGVVTGVATGPQGGQHAVIWTDGRMSKLGTLGGWTAAEAINDQGEVVGQAYVGANVSHAFLYKPDVRFDLGTLPAGANSVAHALNNTGQVVGESDAGGEDDPPFIFNGVRMANLNTLLLNGGRWKLLEARAINDAGQIVGVGEYREQASLFPVRHAYLLTPQAPPVKP